MEAEMLEVQSLPPYVEPFLQLSQGYFSEASHQLVKAALRVAVEKLDGMTRYDSFGLTLGGYRDDRDVRDRIGS